MCLLTPTDIKNAAFGGRPPTHFEFDGAKVLLYFDICKFFVHFLKILHIYHKKAPTLLVSAFR